MKKILMVCILLTAFALVLASCSGGEEGKKGSKGLVTYLTEMGPAASTV